MGKGKINVLIYLLSDLAKKLACFQTIRWVFYLYSCYIRFRKPSPVTWEKASVTGWIRSPPQKPCAEALPSPPECDCLGRKGLHRGDPGWTRSVRRALTQRDWCLYKKRLGHKHAQGKITWIHREHGHLHAKERGLNSDSQALGLKINSCVGHPVCGPCHGGTSKPTLCPKRSETACFFKKHISDPRIPPPKNTYN